MENDIKNIEKNDFLNKNEKNLLLFIKYAPLILIFILSFILTVLIFIESSRDLQRSVENTKENFTQINKKNVKDRVSYIHDHITLKKKNALAQLKERLKDEVYHTHNVAMLIYEKNKNTKTKEEIVEIIKYVLRAHSYNKGKGYFFIDDIYGNKILHPLNPDLEGQNLLDFKDTKGYEIVKSIVETIKNKTERFDEYYWYKDNDKSKSYKKLGFYKYFAPYDYAIGTGEYLDNFEKYIKNEVLEYVSSINSKCDDYIFIVDKDSKIISHRDESFIGKEISEIVENADYNNLLKAVNADGFISYDFNIKEDENFHKTSFLEEVEEWGWIIGSGYINHKLEKTIEKKKKELEIEQRNKVNIIIASSIFLTVILMLISLKITTNLQNRFIEYKLNISRKEEEKSKALIKNAKIYEELFENNKSIILLIDPSSGNIVNANRTAREFYGYTKEELLELNISQINTLSKKEIRKEMDNAASNKRNYFNFIHRLANGEEKYVRVNSSLSTYFDSPVLFSIISDVSGEYIAKNKLLKSENEFKLLFEFSNIGLGIRDTNGNFIKMNRKLVDMLGYDEEFLLGKNCTHISSKEKLSEEIRLFKELISKKINNYSIEKTFIKKDGTRFEAILSMASLVNNKGEITHILSSIVDISEMKRKDNILFQQSKMAAMGEMIGNIAHQWKQPLNLISLANGAIRLNREVEGFSTEEEIDNAIENITNSVEYLSTTIDDFRNFFKPNKQTQFFKLNNTFEKAFKLTSAQYESRGIEIIKNIQSLELDNFENELIQVLMNILNNARDALDEKQGEKLIFIDVFEKEEKAIIEIKDNAGGIKEDVLPKIFEPYFTTKHQSRGTGIGLYMSQEIIVKHLNGEIFVNNIEYTYKDKECKGAKFTITLDML